MKDSFFLRLRVNTAILFGEWDSEFSCATKRRGFYQESLSLIGNKVFINPFMLVELLPTVTLVALVCHGHILTFTKMWL
jgi:hypothetical protein